jgi:hypothetical protein
MIFMSYLPGRVKKAPVYDLMVRLLGYEGWCGYLTPVSLDFGK